jgi:hypothetical protein
MLGLTLTNDNGGVTTENFLVALDSLCGVVRKISLEALLVVKTKMVNVDGSTYLGVALQDMRP